MPYKFRDIQKRLLLLGYEIIRQKGSHVIFRREKHIISIPKHGSKDISKGLENQLIKTLELSAEEFRNLK